MVRREKYVEVPFYNEKAFLVISHCTLRTRY